MLHAESAAEVIIGAENVHTPGGQEPAELPGTEKQVMGKERPAKEEKEKDSKGKGKA